MSPTERTALVAALVTALVTASALFILAFWPHEPEPVEPPPPVAVVAPHPDLSLDFDAFAAKHFPDECRGYATWSDRAAEADRALAAAVAAGSDEDSLRQLGLQARHLRAAADSSRITLKDLVRRKQAELRGELSDGAGRLPTP